MQGEAVLGLEAAARALVKPGTRCLNLVSGVYAAWFGDWLREYGAEVHEVRVPYDEAIDPAAVAQALDEHGPFELVALVHSETPSGIENPLAEIGPLAHEHGALMLADVVSSLGGTQLLIDEWHVDVAVAGPQKCLAGPPGMSLITVSPRAWEAMESNPTAPRGSFLSLLDWKHRWIDGGRVAFPYTPSVSDVNGVHAALRGGARRGARRSRSRPMPEPRAHAAPGVTAMGLELWPRSESYAANCVTAVRDAGGRRRCRRAGARARALRRDALRRLRRVEGEPDPARSHGPGEPLALPAGRGLGARSRTGRPRRLGRCRRGRAGGDGGAGQTPCRGSSPRLAP